MYVVHMSEEHVPSRRVLVCTLPYVELLGV